MADKTKYRVSGGSDVLGNPPGSVFEADLDEDQERFFLDSGHLSKAAGNAKVKDGEQVLTAAAARAASDELNTPATAVEAEQIAAPVIVETPADQQPEEGVVVETPAGHMKEEK